MDAAVFTQIPQVEGAFKCAAHKNMALRARETALACLASSFQGIQWASGRIHVPDTINSLVRISFDVMQ